MSGGYAPPAEILRGYAPGVLGRCVELHALTYARLSGFGRFFASRVGGRARRLRGSPGQPRQRLLVRPVG